MRWSSSRWSCLCSSTSCTSHGRRPSSAPGSPISRLTSRRPDGSRQRTGAESEMWFLQVFESLGISWETFVTQAAALALWICLAAIVYSVIEALVNRLDNEQAALLNAYVIWLFFGIAGAHRVYFGRIGSGLAFLVLVTIA